MYFNYTEEKEPGDNSISTDTEMEGNEQEDVTGTVVATRVRPKFKQMRRALTGMS